jgi:molybdopterin-binding protein
MVVVFGTFLISDLTLLKFAGLGLAISILLDATVIRLFLAPALMRLLGKWNWWAPVFSRRTFVTRVAMARNIFAAEIRDRGDEEAIADIFFPIVDIRGTLIEAVTSLRGWRHASIRPEDILVSTQPFFSSARNTLVATITDVVRKGQKVYLTVNLPPDLVCSVTRRYFEEMELRKGAQVYVTFEASAVNVF